ncbi:hypothetical protein B0H10DRAFT_2028172 [Mycena sp. CBHHK59/15]|nr:hypothetical protein B0H10DRAFT_2028172 [Mycena sp. CBHHK59/15]
MPIPTLQRHSRPNSPHSNATSTPLRPSLSGASNTPSSGTAYSPTVTQGGHQQKLNVVTRVAIEGKAKQGQDGAGIRMYLKVCGTPVSLIAAANFPPDCPATGHVKILSSQVHPLDNNSVPYDFSSDLSPLLHHAARALNLPSRSSESYHTAFGLSPPATSASQNNGSTSSSRSATPPVDTKYTGHILVSGYHISYVLPKAFPARYQDSDMYSRSSGSVRRSSIVERNSVQFMAAIDMWVPYASRPPRSPYLLSIPTPRCLHNNVRLRIFPPTAASASFASLSSADDESGSWDLTSDPHVTRATSSRQSRSGTYSYGNIADDESSDSSTAGFSDGCGIQGTFPSAERIRVRWAKPIKVVGKEGDGRRRVGVKDVKGEMTCAVLGKMRDPEQQREGIVMSVEYKGTCKGVWFPGVATMLGMDVSLEAKGSDVSWIPGKSNDWEVGGGSGYTGFDVGAPPKPDPPSRHDSIDSNYSNGGPQIFLSAERQPSGMPSRQNSASSSNSSLLRQPLPAHNVAEYSFEGSGPSSVSASQTTSIESSVGSLLPSSTPSLDQTPRPPGVPVTIHVNMNELSLPASKNSFPFWISGTVLITPRPILPRSSPSRSSSPVRGEQDGGSLTPPLDPESIVIPRFTVLAADNESISIIVRNEVDPSAPSTVEVYNSTQSSESYQRSNPTKTMLHRGEYAKCAERTRIAVKPSVVFSSGMNGSTTANGKLHPPSRPRTPSSGPASRDRVPSTSTRAMAVLGMVSRPKRDGALMIPSVVATVTPLVVMLDNASGRLAAVPSAYAVRVCLAAPVDSDSDWLEFGLAKHASGGSGASLGPPKVDIVSVSVDDVPVLYETSVAVKQEEPGVGLPFEQMSGQEWVSWVKLRVGAAGGGRIVVDYVVRDVGGGQDTDMKGKMKAQDEIQFDVYLPSFGIPVGRLEVNIDGIPGLEISSLRSNFSHHQSVRSGRRLLHYSLQAFFYPNISLDIRLDRVSLRTSPALSKSAGQLIIVLVSWAILLLGSLYLMRLHLAVSQLSNTLEDYSLAVASGWHDSPEPVTITTTAFHGSRWWFNGDASSSDPTVSPAPAITLLPTPSVVPETPRISPTPTAEPNNSISLFRPLYLNFTWPEVDLDRLLNNFSAARRNYGSYDFG